MDLASQCSVHESVEDKVRIGTDKFGKVDETKIESNGSCALQHLDGDKSDAVEKVAYEDLTPLGTKVNTSPSPFTTKGYGLKKWRRIRREINRDASSNSEDGKLLKRGFSNSGVHLAKPMQFSAQTNRETGISVSSTNATMRRTSAKPDGRVIFGESELFVGSNLGADIDSENSEDRSSKSSTSASIPKMRHKTPPMTGHMNFENRIKNSSGRYSGNSVQKGHQGKGRTETLKKTRGEKVKIEKENSHSSMESDSRSSNNFCLQGINSVTGDSRQRERSLSDNGENSGDARGGERQLSDGQHTEYGRDTREFEDASQSGADSSWKGKEETNENHASSSDQNPLDESILALHSAQEALEQELLKFKDIGKEDNLINKDGSSPSSFPPIHKQNSSEQHETDNRGHSTSSFLETKVISLRQNLNLQESRLEESSAVLEKKEARIAELEAELDGRNLIKKEEDDAILLHGEKYKELVSELEDFFRQKIEAEVEFLTISRAVPKLRMAAVNQVRALEEQGILGLDQAQMASKLGNADERASSKADELEPSREEHIRKLRKCMLCFLTQFLLLVMLFILQLSPHDAVVPT